MAKKSEVVDTFDTDNDRVLRISEVAEFVGKTRQTVGNWIRDGLLRVVKHPSGLPGIMESELRKFYGSSALSARPDKQRK